jgi:hypothetical protein
VLNVRPAGMRPAGSLITLVVALRDHGHHGKGNGNGNGNGNGGGDGRRQRLTPARSPAAGEGSRT